MRKTKKASPAGTHSGKTSAAPLKAKSLSELRELQRLAGAAPASAPDPLHQDRRRPHRFLPPRPGPVTPSDRPTGEHSRASEPALPVHAHLARTHSTPDPLIGAAARPVTPTGRTVTQSGEHTATGSTGAALSPEDIALFRRVVESVTPGPESDRLLLAPVPPATPAQLKQRRQQAMGLDTTPALDVSDHYASGKLEHDDTVFLQAGQGPHLIKGLKKGKWPVEASLDLHGSTLDHARDRMDRFIQSCRDHDIRCVRIVHGKGYGSKDGNPVLKETVRRWLSQLAVVQAYVESDEANGGAGAVLVLLNKAHK